MQERGDGYAVHDLVLDFAKFKIAGFDSIRENVISRQAQYLGRLDVIRAYAKGRKDGAGFLWLIALWRSLEELHGDIELEEKTYKNSLCSLECSEASSDVALAYDDVASLFDLQVGFRIDVFGSCLSEVILELFEAKAAEEKRPLRLCVLVLIFHPLSLNPV